MNISHSVGRLKAANYLQLAMQKPTLEAHVLAAAIEAHLRHFKEAISNAERAISIAPSASDGHRSMGHILTWYGKPEQGIMQIKEAIRLDPHLEKDARINAILANAYFSMGQYERAIDYFMKSFELNANLYAPFSPLLAASYALSGNMNDASDTLTDYLKIFNGYSPPIQFLYWAFNIWEWYYAIQGIYFTERGNWQTLQRSNIRFGEPP